MSLFEQTITAANDTGPEEIRADKMKLSPFQDAIMSFATESSDNFIVNAVAGSGKTTTAVLVGKALGTERTTFLAFNKSIASELQLRGLPSASTFHSAAYGVLRKRHGKFTVDSNKAWRLARGIIPEHLQEDYASVTIQLAGLAKQACWAPDTINLGGVQESITHHDMDFSADDYQLFKFVKLLLEKQIAEAVQKHTIDFDDMLYIPWLDKIPFVLSDVLIVDEAQDTNLLQRSLLATSNARIIAVGDPHQSIYGFRGASSDALDAIAKQFNCQSLPLSTCYRCDETIVREAQRLVPHIQWREGAPQGVVRTVAPLELTAEGNLPDAIVCRTNAPIVRLFFRLARNGIPVQILGRDLGKAIAKTITATAGKATGFSQMRNLLELWADAEIRKAEKRGGTGALVEDKLECILAVMEHVESKGGSPNTVASEAERLFTDSETPGRITLSTIHKAKGREWNRLAFYAPELLPGKWARQDWQIRQEQNLQYVAITRAAHDLLYVRQLDKDE